MRHGPLVLVGLAALMAPWAASAQVSYNTPGGRGNLGGGFIEYLVTGRDPGHAAPNPYAGQRRGGLAPAATSANPYLEGDPFEEPSAAPRGRRLSSLPVDPGEGIGPNRREPASQYRRQEVSYDGPEAPGTIVVDTPSKYLYHVLPGGRAIRYGIGVGRPGFEWAGMKTVSRKAEWPGWTPPPEMRKRQPGLPTHMEGGPGNPLGARALYLGSSLYRIHGTNEPWTIGKNVSSGCIRMMNDDVIHLYGRVGVGTRVKVI